MKPKDWMVFYQYAPRERNWIETRKAKFAKACGVIRVKTFRSPNIAKDVTFYAVEKQ